MKLLLRWLVLVIASAVVTIPVAGVVAIGMVVAWNSTGFAAAVHLPTLALWPAYKFCVVAMLCWVPFPTFGAVYKYARD